MPQDVADVWDLEMSKSLRAAADEAFDAREHEQLMEESQTYLTKFIKEKPDHPEFLAAVTLWSDFPVKHALQLIRAAKAAADKDKQAVLLNEARRVAAKWPPCFSGPPRSSRSSWRNCRRRSKRRPATKPPTAARNGIQRREALFQIALIDYYSGANLSGSERSGTCGSSEKSVPRV